MLDAANCPISQIIWRHNVELFVTLRYIGAQKSHG